MKLLPIFCFFTVLITGRLFGGWASSTEAGILGLTLRDAAPAGARITAMSSVSPAVQSGILVEDIIVEVDKKPVGGAAACMDAIWTRLDVQENDHVVLTIERNDRRTSAIVHRLLEYDNGFDPKRFRLPGAYRDYQMLPGSLSPHGRYAFIYPKRRRLNELKEYGLYLVTSEPFCILTRISLGNSNLAGNTRCYYAASWAKYASLAVFIAGSRWGPERVTAV